MSDWAIISAIVSVCLFATGWLMRYLAFKEKQLAAADKMQALERKFYELETRTKEAIVNLSKKWGEELDAVKSPGALGRGMGMPGRR